MKRSTLMACTVAASALWPIASNAQMAYVNKDVNLRAGPAMEYPVVMRLRARVTLSVIGCLPGYQWCDVEVGPNRGWVYAGNIVYPYQGAYVPVHTYGAAIGIGVVAFMVGNYWDDHYRARPWYPQRQHWIDRPHPGYGPGDHRRPPGPVFRPGDHHPPPPPPHVSRDHRAPPPPPPHGGSRDHRPPAPAVVPGGHRGPERSGPAPDSHRQPQHQAPSRGDRPAQGHEQGGSSGRPPKDHRPDGR